MKKVNNNTSKKFKILAVVTALAMLFAMVGLGGCRPSPLVSCICEDCACENRCNLSCNFELTVEVEIVDQGFTMAAHVRATLTNISGAALTIYRALFAIDIYLGGWLGDLEPWNTWRTLEPNKSITLIESIGFSAFDEELRFTIIWGFQVNYRRRIRQSIWFYYPYVLQLQNNK